LLSRQTVTGYREQVLSICAFMGGSFQFPKIIVVSIMIKRIGAVIPVQGFKVTVHTASNSTRLRLITPVVCSGRKQR
jgi:hypothetical protein